MEWRRNGVGLSELELLLLLLELEWRRSIGVGVVLQTYVQSTLGNYLAQLLVPTARTIVPTDPSASFAIDSYTSSGHTQSSRSMA